MKEEISFSVDEVLRVFRFLENSNELFHQPMRYEDKDIVQKFAKDNYPEIRELYYRTIWNKLPKYIQDEITGE
ncbi:hypothetical protein [Shewanella ulleungensis]|uniref:Uncharacterized protein n=1 Tax=Shewanella ulleungensis TaxID=2282699 RepID=A0ABQ2QXR1_9GAMM|nr:hypothetical protein [Shewanella ulleungensis]MCL1152418.1 hypothetical protein [Shewanella ulleungensis]GGQ02505.1 hypothetical protein GCM10009410_39580 [Shewanella ulleungensis]